MRVKINPKLLRKKITQLWTTNLYIQKPYKIENIFIKTFKIIFLIKLFLKTFRSFKLFSNNKKLQKKLKKITHSLIEISNFKILNILCEKKQQKLYIFCNIISRSSFTSNFLKLLDIKAIHFNLNKKLKKNLYTNNRSKNFFFKLKIKNKTQIIQKKNIFKIFNYKYQKSLWLKKKKQIIINKKKTLKYWNKLLLKPLLKRKKNWQLINYARKIKLKTKPQKNIKLFFFKPTILKKNLINQKFKINKTWIKESLISIKFNLKKNYIKTKQLKTKNKKKKLIKQKLTNYTNILDFIYSQFFNIILENNINAFLLKFLNKNMLIKIQTPQNFPLLKKQLTYIFNNILYKKTQLKKNIMTFKNLFFMFPSFNIFYLSHLVNEQFATYLSKTKKHWRIIRTFETFLIKYLNANNDFLHKNSQITGIKIVIRGRPNKSSRTKKIILQYGTNKQTQIKTNNLTKSFYSANAQIGTFGITFLTNI